MSAAVASLCLPAPNAMPLRELQDSIDRLQALVRRHASLSAETATEMAKLSELCDARFRQEEGSSLYENLPEQAPWLLDNLRAIVSQHNRLRERLNSLCYCSQRQQPLPRVWMEFSEELSFFCRQLNDHEQAEFDFWQSAYCRDVGTKD